MRKSKKALILSTMAFMAIAATACGNKKAVEASKSPNTATAESSVSEDKAGEETGNADEIETDGEELSGAQATEFVADENAKYTLVLDGESKDISSYVVSYKDSVLLVKSSILTDLFGYTKSDRSNDEMMEYTTADGKILQLMIGTNDMTYDGGTSKISGSIEKIEDSDEVSVSMDFLLGMGLYNSYNTAILDGELVITPSMVDESEFTVETEAVSDSVESYDETEAIDEDMMVESEDLGAAEEVAGETEAVEAVEDAAAE